MRKHQKAQAEELIKQMGQAHVQMKNCIDKRKSAMAMELLKVCQEAAISLGTLIERTQGEGNPTVKLLEEYCELIYGLYEMLENSTRKDKGEIFESVVKAFKQVKSKLTEISADFQRNVKVRLEAVFLPYKASMWDSLESVWRAADADPDCDAYVVPIPYYDKNPDGSFGEMHYEADKYPADVHVIWYDEYDFEARRPDMVFIHNPYDDCNFVTSIHPSFYSGNIKKFTECLIYIPYYATAGGMAEGQTWCPAYENVDYIVIQSEKYKEYFDRKIPESKFWVLGSPKFDSVIHKCQNRPEPPDEWKEKIRGRKVYFYNTSIGGMLGDTESFLKKMNYVFECFRGRQDVCLIWRPHPLLGSTFDSLRPMYKPIFEALKKAFVEEDMGILDETPDMEKTIALSDVYIGDSGTSVTSLFGVAGKPMFILNNNIHTSPKPEDWRGERVNPQYGAWGDNRYYVTGNNQLWFSEKNDFQYRFYMDLEIGYSAGSYYMQAVEIKGKVYVIPCNAQNILVIENGKIRKIELRKFMVQGQCFLSWWRDERCRYLYLFPFRYPLMVRLHLDTGKLEYLNGARQFYVRRIGEEWKTGGISLYENELVFASPEDNGFLFMNAETLEIRSRWCPEGWEGTQGMVPHGEVLWLLPMKGMKIMRWNPRTGESREYSDMPEGFKALKWPHGFECEEHPFGYIAFFQEDGRAGDYQTGSAELGKTGSRAEGRIGISGEKTGKMALISPNWGNMYLSLDLETGKTEEWKLPFGSQTRVRDGYFATAGMGGFVMTEPERRQSEDTGIDSCRIWYAPERKLYEINVYTKKYKEIKIDFDYEDLLKHEPGFMEDSEWMQYCLNENAFNSLENLLDGRIIGNPFDRERQLAAFSKINVDKEGACGRNIYESAKGKVL